MMNPGGITNDRRSCPVRSRETLVRRFQSQMNFCVIDLIGLRGTGAGSGTAVSGEGDSSSCGMAVEFRVFVVFILVGGFIDFLLWKRK
jgi:hypothetical protein